MRKKIFEKNFYWRKVRDETFCTLTESIPANILKTVFHLSTETFWGETPKKSFFYLFVSFFRLWKMNFCWCFQTFRHNYECAVPFFVWNGFFDRIRVVSSQKPSAGNKEKNINCTYQRNPWGTVLWEKKKFWSVFEFWSKIISSHNLKTIYTIPQHWFSEVFPGN